MLYENGNSSAILRALTERYAPNIQYAPMGRHSAVCGFHAKKREEICKKGDIEAIR